MESQIFDREAIEVGECMGLSYELVPNGIGAINGYVKMPEGLAVHIDSHDYGYDEDSPLSGVDVHGGITFNRDGWLGFDTAHCDDRWPDEGPTELTTIQRKIAAKYPFPDGTRFDEWNLSRLRREVIGFAAQIKELADTIAPPTQPKETEGEM